MSKVRLVPTGTFGKTQPTPLPKVKCKKHQSPERAGMFATNAIIYASLSKQFWIKENSKPLNIKITKY